MDKYSKHFFIFIIAVIVSTLNVLHVLFASLQGPTGSVYSGTGTYYLDYFQYLQAIFAGARGDWVFHNYLATGESLNTFFGFWQYLILGKIGKLFFLNPVTTYWVAVFVLSVIACFLIYKTIAALLKNESFITHICALILFIFATPFYLAKVGAGGWSIELLRSWYDRSNFFERFEGVPAHIIALIISLLIILGIIEILDRQFKLPINKIIIRAVYVSLLLIFLLTFAPSYAILIFLALVVSIKKPLQKKYLIWFFTVAAVFVPGAFLAKYHYNATPFFFRMALVDRYLGPGMSLGQIILSAGPLVIFSFLGLPKFIKNLSDSKRFFLILVLISYLLVATPLSALFGIQSMRFLTPINYIFLSSLAVLSVRTTKRVILLTGILFLLYLPANIKIFTDHYFDRNFMTPVTYLPKNIIAGFKFLDNIPGDRGILTAKNQNLGLVLTSFVKKKVFIGRSPATSDYENKAVLSDRFFNGQMSQAEAKKFLTENKIGFIVLTSIDDNINQLKYAFITKIFQNKDISIFEFKK